MIAFIAANMAPIMFAPPDRLPAVRLSRSRSRWPPAACSSASSASSWACCRASLLQALPLRIFGIMQNDTLLAIPFFTFMGLILERSGMAEDLLDTIGQLFGPIRGGLAYRGDPRRRDAGGHHRRRRRVGDLDGPDLAADHAALRLRPAHRHRRDRRLGHAGADHSAVAGADHPGRPARPSVGDLYKGAFIPGFVLTGLYLGYVVLVALVKPAVGAGAAAGSAHHPRGRRHAPACARCGVLFVLLGRGCARRCSPKTRPASTPTDEMIVAVDVRRRRRRLRAGGASTALLRLEPAVAAWPSG